jgi:antibiotic biosynthesis monooxygenase (ABM) superfamily enzyme
LITTITSLISCAGQEPFAAAEFERTFRGQTTPTRHAATLLIQQQNGLSFLVSSFRTQADLDEWRRSPEHGRMVAAYEAHSLRELCTIDHPVARVVVPSDGSGPKWKSLVSSWLVTFPLLLVVAEMLNVILPGAPPIVRVALTSIAMSIAIAWFISPLLMKMTRTWRLRHQQMQITFLADEGDAALDPDSLGRLPVLSRSSAGGPAARRSADASDG